MVYNENVAMKNVRHWFISHEKNDHKPYFLRYQALSVFAVTLLLVQVVTNVVYSGSPQVLGFATSVYQNEIISLTNTRRTQNGAGILAESSRLNQAAQLKAQNMFADNYWAHNNPHDPAKTPWYWFDQVGYQYYMAGENLAMNFDTSVGVINGWMASQSHRENMLNGEFTEIGVAVVNGVLLGEETTLVVQLFGKPLGAQTSNPSQPTNTPAPTMIPAQTQPTAVPTIPPSPTPTPTPTPETVTAIVRTPTGVAPLQTSAEIFGGEQRWRAVQSNVANPLSLSTGRLIMLSALTFLMLVFLVDALVVVHRQHFHIPKSRGFVQAGIIGLALVTLLYNSVGTIL